MKEYLEVYYEQYCKTCKHVNEKGEDRFNPNVENDYCDECLAHPYQLESHKPICWEEK